MVDDLFQPLLNQTSDARMQGGAPFDALVAVAVLSLPDCVGRRERLVQRGLPPAWVERYWPGVDLRGSGPVDQSAVFDRDGAWRRYLRPWRGSELGCALSHRSALQAFLAGSSRLLLVLEDDVIPDGLPVVPALSVLVKPFLEARPQPLLCHLGPRPENLDPADLRRLRFCGAGRLESSQSPLRVHQNRNRPLWRAHAYLISREAARRCLALEPDRLSLLADDWQARRQAGALGLLLVVVPPMFRQDDDTPSTQQDPIPRSASCPDLPPWQRLGRGLRYRGRAAADRLLRRFPYRLS